MSASGDTRERIVDAAAELFHERGFQATSLAEVAERAGARPGSLYYFFKTKDELLRGALERYGDLLEPVIMGPAFARSDHPVERVFEVLGRYRELLLETDFALGCPIGNLALEIRDASIEVRAGIVSNLTLWARFLEVNLEAAVPEGVDRGRLARFVLTVMEGAVLLARAHRDIVVFDEAVAQLRDYFDRLTSPGRAGRVDPAGGGR